MDCSDSFRRASAHANRNAAIRNGARSAPGPASGTTCVPSADTAPVPYGTIVPWVGSSVISGMSVPGGVFDTFGKYTATGWLAVAFGRLERHDEHPHHGGHVRLHIRQRSTGTCTAASGNGFGLVAIGQVNVVPAYTVTDIRE